MSSALLIYLGENVRFDLSAAVSAIALIPGISDLREGMFIGAIFECKYEFNNLQTTIRISPDCEIITVQGLGVEAVQFATELQQRFMMPLHATDTNFSFQVELAGMLTAEDLSKATAEQSGYNHTSH